jgi:hypothetical protein
LIAIVAAGFLISAEQPAPIAQLGLFTAILWRKWQVQMDGESVKMAIHIIVLTACVTRKI